MIQFLNEQLWNTIQDLSIKAVKTQVAVAYVGTGASDLLKLKKNDVLITALNVENAKAGTVNPYEIEIYFKSGVKVFTINNLHAKIFIFDQYLIVASSNVSHNSKERLVETGLLTDDVQTVSEANKFINDVCIDKVNIDLIELCKTHYKKPIFEQAKPLGDSKRNVQLPTIWFVSIDEEEFTEEEKKLLERDERIFQEKLEDKNTFLVQTIKYGEIKDTNDIEDGDIIIQMVDTEEGKYILEPARILGKSNFSSSSSKSTMSFLRIQEKKEDPDFEKWLRFERVMKSAGIDNLNRIVNKPIKNDNTKTIILDYWKKRASK